MKTKPYKLYAIRTADLPQGALKGFQYSLQANGRYCLVYSNRTLAKPFVFIPEGTKLEPDENTWLLSCKTELNLQAMKDDEELYSDLLNQFLDNFSKELEKTQQAIGDSNDSTTKSTPTE